MAIAKAPKTQYVCSACGTASPRWLGRCGRCGEWDTLVEERVTSTEARRASSTGRTGTPGAPGGRVAVRMDAVEAEQASRRSTGLGELDRVLGGGVVEGGVVLVGGDPGIGKSTLLMQALAGLVRGGARCLYATGEESASQVAMRARRIGGEAMGAVEVIATTELEDIEAAVDKAQPTVLVVDSIQTVRALGLESAAGSVGQLREVATRLTEMAKSRGVAVFLIGHVTKDGMLAGPKVLEHLVDTVLAFEGDRTHSYRIVRTTKNRFGPAHEAGVFEMVREGLREVPDPSALFLAERPKGSSGSVVVPTAEGSRPMLVEVQALVAPAVYGAARRVATGVDGNRLSILLAVLERRADVHVLDRDVFASIAGGARVEDTAIELALAVAVVSSLRDRAIDAATVVFGEVGLAGEVRAVPRAGLRIVEARKMGFSRVILPASSIERLGPEEKKGVVLEGVKTLADACAAAFH